MQSGEWKDGDALFMRASVWREFAEHVASSLTKGSRVVATGRLRQRSYETKEGEKRTSIELEIDDIGPSLRYATAQVQRQSSGARTGGAVEDSWSAPAAGGATQDPVGQCCTSRSRAYRGRTLLTTTLRLASHLVSPETERTDTMAGKSSGDRRKPRGVKGGKPQAPVKPITVGVIDYKDVSTLRRFISERGKIRARRITGVSVQEQRLLAKAIKNAREMALLPYAGAGR